MDRVCLARMRLWVELKTKIHTTMQHARNINGFVCYTDHDMFAHIPVL